jgi:ankyrin repeat protein
MENLEEQFFDAVYDNNIDIVNDLIEKGVNVNAKNEIERSALLIAITKKLYVEKKNYTDIIKLLIKSGADVNEIDRHKVSLLMKAIENDNDKDIIDILIKAGADVNKLDKYNNTALMISSRRNNIDITKMLIEAGADVNKVNKNDATALTFARTSGIADILINAGALVDKESLVINAVKKGHSEIVELMIEKGVDVNIIYDFNKIAGSPNLSLTIGSVPV